MDLFLRITATPFNILFLDIAEVRGDAKITLIRSRVDFRILDQRPELGRRPADSALDYRSLTTKRVNMAGVRLTPAPVQSGIHAT